jgi:ATP-dependent DNA helicase PIF1
VYPKLDENKVDSNYITSRAILTKKYDCVDRINTKMINKFHGYEKVYHSFDEVVDDSNNYYPSEFLNTLMPNGLPPHVLKLKENSPVILLWNIDPAESKVLLKIVMEALTQKTLSIKKSLHNKYYGNL